MRSSFPITPFSKSAPTLVFKHLFTNSSQAIQTQLGINAHKEPSINDDYGLAQQEDFCAGRMSHSRRRWLRRMVIGLFSAHDHGDTWCYKWDTRSKKTASISVSVNTARMEAMGAGFEGLHRFS